MTRMPPSRLRIGLAFAAVYLVWGSTYLAIRYAIQTLPPFLMAGGRFILAGSVLYVFARRSGAAPPERRHLLPAVVIGGLMLLIGNGGVVLAEKSVPSGLAALVVATVPLFITAVESLRQRVWPSPLRLVALAVGFVAVGLLVDPGTMGGGSAFGIALLSLSAFSWALGSLYSRRAPRPASSLVATSLQMLAGGVLQLIAGTLHGEWAEVHLGAVSGASIVAFLYLVAFGSLVGFTAYAWLLQVVSPTLAATYAYVNPVVAVLLGWLIAGEPIGPRTVVAAVAIVASVVLITRPAPRPPAPAPVPDGLRTGEQA
jgi:drug/metabolite transporter (DMT)-like permease